MGSRSYDYTQGGQEIPRYMRNHVPQQSDPQEVDTNYYAVLTNEQFGEVQSSLRNLDGNPQVRRHPTRGNIYVVTVDCESLNTSLQDQILEAFRSQYGQARKADSLR